MGKSRASVAASLDTLVRLCSHCWSPVKAGGVLASSGPPANPGRHGPCAISRSGRVPACSGRLRVVNEADRRAQHRISTALLGFTS
jgi:hypothetical protein